MPVENKSCNYDHHLSFPHFRPRAFPPLGCFFGNQPDACRWQALYVQLHLPEIIDDTLALRDRYFPNAKVSVLSNSTFIHKPAVFDALLRVDNNILKLDTVDEDYIRALDRPTGAYSVERIVAGMKAFQGRCIIQTMFLKGGYQGRDMDNTSDRFVLPWLERVKEIAPRQVMIYTIDRETPDHDLCKATHEELDRIGALVREVGIEVSVSY